MTPKWAPCLGPKSLRAQGVILTLAWRGCYGHSSSTVPLAKGLCLPHIETRGRPHLRDEDQSQCGGDCAVGVKEEEEERPVWVQGGNQYKPEGEVGRRWLATGGSGLFPLTCFSGCPPQPPP